MNCTCDCMLKRNMDDIIENTIVFSTNKTLNERFTPKEPPRYVFIVNNGYTMPYRNNTIKEKIIIENEMRVKIHKRFSLYEQENIEKTLHEGKNDLKYEANVEKNGVKQKCNELTLYKRRVILKPINIDDNNEPSEDFHNNSEISEDDKNFKDENSDIIELKPNQVRSENNSTAQPLKSKRRNVIYRTRRSIIKRPRTTYFTNNNFKYYKTKPFVLSCRNVPYFRQPLMKWKRRLPTKAQLDNELDMYMASVNFKTPITKFEDVDTFIQKYMTETEKYLNEQEKAGYGVCFE